MIAEGLHRACYRHPENPGYCVKVVVRGDQKETEREQAYYSRLQKSAVPWTGIPQFHGNVATNLGAGAVFDLVRDCDGQVSRTLHYYLEPGNRSLLPGTVLQSCLLGLKSYLLHYGILTLTIKPANVVYQRLAEGQGRLVIIDNLGIVEFLPLCRSFGMLAQKRILRRWNRFEQKLWVEYFSYTHADPNDLDGTCTI